MIMIFLIGVLVIIHVWILWDIILSDWGEMDIGLDAEELGSDLYDGLHLHRRDD